MVGAGGSEGCGECGLRVGLDEAERTGRRLHSDGLGELLPFCAACGDGIAVVPAALLGP